MNKIKFFEALYASNSAIVARKKSIVLPIILIVIGIIIPLVGMQLLDAPEYDNITSTLIIVAMAVCVGGVVWLLRRILGGGEPYCTTNGEYLKVETLNFDRSRKKELLKALAEKNFTSLRAIPSCDISAVTALVCTTADGSFAAAQLFEYSELEYRELSKVTMFTLK